MVVKAVRWGELEIPFRDSPLSRGDWHGRHVSIDGAGTEEWTEEDILRIVHHKVEPDTGGWDGEEVGVIELADGRYVCWETWWGPTGSGFSADAYGGGADIHYAWSLEVLLRLGLTDGGRELLGITL